MSKDTDLSVYPARKPQPCSDDALRGMVQLANEDEPRHFADPGAEEISIGKRQVEGLEQISGRSGGRKSASSVRPLAI